MTFAPIPTRSSCTASTSARSRARKPTSWSRTRSCGARSSRQATSDDLEIEGAYFTDQPEVLLVAGDDPRPDRAGGERDEGVVHEPARHAAAGGRQAAPQRGEDRARVLPDPMSRNDDAAHPLERLVEGGGEPPVVCGPSAGQQLLNDHRTYVRARNVPAIALAERSREPPIAQDRDVDAGVEHQPRAHRRCHTSPKPRPLPAARS